MLPTLLRHRYSTPFSLPLGQHRTPIGPNSYNKEKYICTYNVKQYQPMGFSLCPCMYVFSQKFHENNPGLTTCDSLCYSLLFLVHSLYSLKIIIVKGQLSPAEEVSDVYYSLWSHTALSNSNSFAFLKWPHGYLTEAVV